VEFHEAAEIYPLLEDDELDSLVQSIRHYGLKESIKMIDGKIIDGRNRYRACLLAHVEPDFEDAWLTNGELPQDYVYQVNYKRRHLDTPARAMAASKYKKQVAKEAKNVHDEALSGGKVAIKAAIDEHVPTVNETARNDAGRRWYKFLHDLWKLSNSPRNAGGVAKLTKRL